MDELVQRFAAVLAAHRGWAGPAFGLLALGESTAVLGTLIPATPLLFVVGTLIGSGTLDAARVLPWAVAGAIAGYWLSWVAGRRLGHDVYRRPFLRTRRRGVARVRLFFRRWGGPALIVGRYVLGPFQSMLPLVAGVAAMPPRRFHAWSTVSGLIWVPAVVAPGYLAARGSAMLGIGHGAQSALAAALGIVSVGLIVAVLVAGLWHRLAPRGRGAAG